MKQTCLSYFLCGFKIKTSVYAWTCDKQPRTCEEQLKTFKHIQKNLNDYYHALILNSHHGNTKQVREKDYTFMQDPYGGGGEVLRVEEKKS